MPRPRFSSTVTTGPDAMLRYRCDRGGYLIGMDFPIAEACDAAFGDEEAAVRGCGNLVCEVCGERVHRVDGAAQLALHPPVGISPGWAGASRLYSCRCMPEGVRMGAAFSPYHQGGELNRWQCAGHELPAPRLKRNALREALLPRVLRPAQKAAPRRRKAALR